MNAIEAEDLSVVLGRNQVLRNVTLSVAESSISALLGPNGAGKTTLIRTMVNIYRPRRGRLAILGRESTALTPRDFHSIGYVAESQEAPMWMTVRRFLGMCAAMYPAWDHQWCGELVRELEIPLDVQLQKLSRGMLVKAKLISSLVFKPRLLLLDEPFSGLDPVVRDEFIQLVVNLCEKCGATVFISSHDLHEVERVAESIIFLANGQVREQASLDTLLIKYRSITAVLNGSPDLPQYLPREWREVQLSERSLQFLHTNFSSELIRDQLHSVRRLSASL